MCTFFWKAYKLVETDVKRAANKTEKTNTGWMDNDQDHSWWRYNKIKKVWLRLIYICPISIFILFLFRFEFRFLFKLLRIICPISIFILFCLDLDSYSSYSGQKSRACLIISNISLFVLEFLFRSFRIS